MSSKLLQPKPQQGCSAIQDVPSSDFSTKNERGSGHAWKCVVPLSRAFLVRDAHGADRQRAPAAHAGPLRPRGQNQTAVAFATFNAQFARTDDGEGNNTSVLRAMWRTYSGSLVLCGLTALFATACNLFTPSSRPHASVLCVSSLALSLIARLATTATSINPSGDDSEVKRRCRLPCATRDGAGRRRRLTRRSRGRAN